MKYKIGMKIKTLKDCALPHDMRAETFTIINSSQSDSLQVEDERGRVMVIGKSYVDKKATRKLNQTKADFNKKLEFDEIVVELAFNQAYVDDTDIFVNICDSDKEIFTNITTKQAKKLVRHLQKMVDYCEE